MKFNLKQFLEKLKEKWISVAIYVTLFIIANRLCYFYRIDDGENFAFHIMGAINNLFNTSILISLNKWDLIISAVTVALIYYYISLKGKKKKIRTRKGEEYGSAKWGTKEDIRPYIDPVDDQNVLLTETESITMENQPKDWKTARNKNILVIGGSGSGKTRGFVKPNLMQMHSSYVVTDPKGQILVECGKMLKRGAVKLVRDEENKLIKDKNGRVQIVYDKNGKPEREPYKIKVLNLINFSKSMHYNPFAYINSENDIMKLVNTIMVNTKGEGEKAGDDFWTKAERLLYMAYIGLIYYEAPKSEQNFETLLMLINMSETREEDENFKNAVDLKFEDLEKENPHHFAVLQYKKYKLAAGKTAKSILISCGARLAPFDIKEVRDLVSYDEMELDLIGDRLTALFVIIPDTDNTFNFIVAMMYTQLFNLLCTRADDVHNGKLPYHVRCLLDEFANIGSIPQFEKLIATIRSREISASIILQAQSQLKAIYKDHTDTIVGNCDTTLFLGGKEKTTLKDLSDALGKETIELFNTGKSFSQTKSSSINYQKTGRDLMTFDEISVMPNDRCILQIRGLRPFYSKKVDIVKHKRYKLLSDYDKKNRYDVTKELDKVKNLEKIIANLEKRKIK